MNPIIKNILAVVAGIAGGSIVNLALVGIGLAIIPAPAGVDPWDAESLSGNMHLYETKHFIFPFLAHALGTLVGAFIAALIAANNKAKFALGIGVWFLIGGAYMAVTTPGPLWFEVFDVLAAYIPMGLLGGKMVTNKMGGE